MIQIKKIISALAMLMLALPLITLQSCKSDEDDLIRNVFDIPTELSVTYGESTPIMALKTDMEDQLVFPSNALNFTSVSEDESIVKMVSPMTAEAVGIGFSNVKIYNSNNEEIATVRITVNPTHEVTIKVGETVRIKDILGSLATTQTISNMLPDDANIATVTWVGAYACIKGVSPGVTYVGVKGYNPDYSRHPVMIKVTVEP